MTSEEANLKAYNIIMNQAVEQQRLSCMPLWQRFKRFICQGDIKITDGDLTLHSGDTKFILENAGNKQEYAKFKPKSRKSI